ARNMTARQRSLSTCSSRISRSSRTKWTKVCARPRPRVRDNKRNKAKRKPRLLNGPVADRAFHKDRSMTDFRPRTFATDADVVHIGEGLLARTLPRDEWTHEAHLAATTYLLTRRPEIAIDNEDRKSVV